MRARNVIVVLVLVAGAIVAFVAYRRTARSLETRETIDARAYARFREADDLVTKYELANDVVSARVMQKATRTMRQAQAKINALLKLDRSGKIAEPSPSFDAPLSPDDEAIYGDMTTLLERVEAEARAFEAGLNADEIARLTAANPSSVYRAAGYLRLRLKPEDCPKDKVSAFLAASTDERLREVARCVPVRFVAAESPHLPAYAKAIQELLRTDPRYAERAWLADTYYRALASYAPPRARRTSLSERKCGEELDTRIGAAYVGQVQAELLKTVPGCVVSVNPTFYRHLERPEDSN